MPSVKDGEDHKLSHTDESDRLGGDAGGMGW